MKITWTIVALAGSTGMVSAQSAPRVPPVPPPAPSPIAATLPRPAEPAVAPAPAETWTSLPGAVAVPWIDITASIAPIAVPIDPLTATLGEGSVVWALQQGQGPVVARPPRPPRPVDADVERLLSQLEREEAARQRAIDAQQRALERELAAEERARQREMEQIGQAARREIETRERAAQREAEQAARVLERELEAQDRAAQATAPRTGPGSDRRQATGSGHGRRPGSFTDMDALRRPHDGAGSVGATGRGRLRIPARERALQSR